MRTERVNAQSWLPSARQLPQRRVRYHSAKQSTSRRNVVTRNTAVATASKTCCATVSVVCAATQLASSLRCLAVSVVGAIRIIHLRESARPTSYSQRDTPRYDKIKHVILKCASYRYWAKQHIRLCSVLDAPNFMTFRTWVQGCYIAGPFVLGACDVQEIIYNGRFRS